MSSDPRPARRAGGERHRQVTRGWRVEHRHAIYRADLAQADLAAADPVWEHRDPGSPRIALDTARAYDMLRASASLAVPLLCLATKG